MRGLRGKQAPPPPPPPPLTNHKNIGFLNNTARDPLKVTKLPSKHFDVGPSSAGMQNGSLIVALGSPLPSSTKIKKKRNVVKVGHPLTKHLDPRMEDTNFL